MLDRVGANVDYDSGLMSVIAIDAALSTSAHCPRSGVGLIHERMRHEDLKDDHSRHHILFCGCKSVARRYLTGRWQEYEYASPGAGEEDLQFGAEHDGVH